MNFGVCSVSEFLLAELVSRLCLFVDWQRNYLHFICFKGLLSVLKLVMLLISILLIRRLVCFLVVGRQRTAGIREQFFCFGDAKIPGSIALTS
jgi:hypothetical protein